MLFEVAEEPSEEHQLVSECVSFLILSPTVDDCYPQCQTSALLYFSFSLLGYYFLKQRIASSVRRLEAGDEGPPVDMLLLAQPLIDIERAAGEERTGPLLANLCFNQRV